MRSVEGGFKLSRDVREHRLVSTVADQAIAGPGSIGFVAHEAVVDKLWPDPSKKVCAHSMLLIVQVVHPTKCSRKLCSKIDFYGWCDIISGALGE